jgi:hypothetical protein
MPFAARWNQTYSRFPPTTEAYAFSNLVPVGVFYRSRTVILAGASPLFSVCPAKRVPCAATRGSTTLTDPGPCRPPAVVC